MTRISILLAAVFSAALVGAPGRAQADRYDLSLGSSTRRMTSSSVDALSDGSMVAFSMTAAMALNGVRVPFVDRVYLDGTFEAGAMNGTSFQTLDTHTSLISTALGARLGRDLSARWSVHGRASLGLARVGVTLSDSFMGGPTLGDAGWTGTAYVGAVSDYLVAERRGSQSASFGLGLRVELGYLAALPKQLDARPDVDRPDGAILIPETAASLGDLDLSSFNLRVGMFGRF